MGCTQIAPTIADGLLDSGMVRFGAAYRTAAVLKSA
jgi:hypothetical protein